MASFAVVQIARTAVMVESDVGLLAIVSPQPVRCEVAQGRDHLIRDGLCGGSPVASMPGPRPDMLVCGCFGRLEQDVENSGKVGAGGALQPLDKHDERDNEPR